VAQQSEEIKHQGSGENSGLWLPVDRVEQNQGFGPSDEVLEIQDPHDFRINVARTTKLLIK